MAASISCRRRERLWKGLVRDPSHWWDKRNTKRNPEDPDFQHRLTKDSICLGRPDCNAAWLHDDLLLRTRCSMEPAKRLGPKDYNNSIDDRCPAHRSEDVLADVDVNKSHQFNNLDYSLQLAKRDSLKPAERSEAKRYDANIEDRRTILQARESLTDQELKESEDTSNRSLTEFVKHGNSQHSLEMRNRAIMEPAERPVAKEDKIKAESCNLISFEAFSTDPTEGKASQKCVSFGSLIGECVIDGNLQLALTLYYLIEDHESLRINEYAFSMLLKACTKMKDLQTGIQLEAMISERGFFEKGNFILGRNLMHMYAKCGSLEKAQIVFDRLCVRDVITWTVLVNSYIEYGYGAQALSFVQEMQYEGVSPDDITFVCGLKACGILRAIGEGRELHSSIIKEGLDGCTVVSNALLGMYLKCSMLLDGEQVFKNLSSKNVISWNSLICGYLENGYDHKAVECFNLMHFEFVCPDEITIMSCLKACGNVTSMDKVQEMHADVIRRGLEEELQVANSLIDVYVNCGLMMTAQQVFNKLEARDVVSWNTLISGYSEQNCDNKVIECIERMKEDEVALDDVTLVCSVKACGKLGYRNKGREIHTEIIKKGLDEVLTISNTLIDKYAKCSSLTEAEIVFDKLRRRNVVSWNTLITGYVEQGNYRTALECFERMLCDGITPDDITLLCCVKSCANIGSARKGQEIHSEIAKKGYEGGLLIGNTLIDMYSKCGLLAAAEETFDRIVNRDVISWNALISGYVEHGQNLQALDSFNRMKDDGVIPADHVTFVCSFKACGNEGILDNGRDMHADIIMKGMEIDLFVGNIMVDMYARCCSLEEAQNVFNNLPTRSLASWNALIAGYAQLGGTENVFCMLVKMMGEGVAPNEVSFIGILNACSHAGLVYKGFMYFIAMSKYYGIIPTLEHYTCMIDLLGRSGHVDEAVKIIQRMPFQPGVIVCHALLGSCRKWGTVEFARQALKHIVQLDEKDIASYACLSNIYIDDSRKQVYKDGFII